MKNSFETGYKIQAHVDLLKYFQKSYNSMKSLTFDKIFKIISISKIFSRMWSVLTGFFLRFVSSTVDFHKFCYVISILHDFTNTWTSNILLKLHQFWISFDLDPTFVNLVKSLNNLWNYATFRLNRIFSYSHSYSVVHWVSVDLNEKPAGRD